MKKAITLTDILIERTKREEKYFKNYKIYAKKIKKVAQEILGPVKVFVFGSILKKNEIPRDIDILIISPKIKSNTPRGEIIAKIWRKIGTLSPFEIHLINPEDYRDWYSHFIKEKIEIK